MKLNIYFLAVLFILMTYSSNFPQSEINIIKYYNSTDSLEVDPYSFFPMGVGNFWQYAFDGDIVREEKVVKDSLFENNSKLIWVSYNMQNNDTPTWIIDTNYQVFLYSSYNVEWPSLYFKLDANLNEEWWVDRFQEDTTQGIIRRVENIFEAEYLGVNTFFKEIVEYIRFIDNGEYQEWIRAKYLLGASLGLVNIRNDEMTRPPEYLYSAIIAGDTLGTIVGVENVSEDLIPELSKLFQNYPNPFNPTTTIAYKLFQSSFTQLKVYNLLGEEIKTIVSKYQAVGNYSYKVDMNGLPSGMYIYRLISNKTISSKKMLYLK